MSHCIKIFDLDIEDAIYPEIINKIGEKIRSRETFIFHNINFYILLSSLNDKQLNNNLKSFDSLYPDGTGVYWASKIIYGRNGLRQRINGTDLYYEILADAEENGHKCFFFGGSRSASELLKKRLENEYPKLKIAGIIDGDTKIKDMNLEKIKKSNADILMVGLGTPYQEYWLSGYSKEIDIPVQLCIGSGIEFLSGLNKRAPRILIKFGLEWLHRLIMEPKRLWKRYIIGIPLFTFKVLIIKIKLMFK